MSPDKTSQLPSTSSLKGRKAAGGGGGGLTRALTMYQDSKKKRSAIVKPRTDRPLSSTTSREKLSGSVLGLQEMGGRAPWGGGGVVDSCACVWANCSCVEVHLVVV